MYIFNLFSLNPHIYLSNLCCRLVMGSRSTRVPPSSPPSCPSHAINLQGSRQIRTGVGACARAARRCVHFPPVLQGPPSGIPQADDQPAATTRHVVGPLASSTHETRSLRESGEQDQRKENEPHVHTAAADAHGRCRKQISFESLSATTRWTHKVRPVMAKDSPKRPGTKGIKSPS